MQLTKTGDQTAVKKSVLGLSRRHFIQGAGVTAGGISAASIFSGLAIKQVKAQASTVDISAPKTVKRTICTHCSHGCGVYAEVQQGVWTKQEPAFDHPFNAGGHCAKGASLRDHGSGDKRVKYPMKLVAGKWQRMRWDDALTEISAKMLTVREEQGPDGIMWIGSAKFSNEQAYLYRKLAAMWGTNNTDHSARICHSTTVAGVANTWGYGAMTNSFNDMHNAKSVLFIGSNPAEAHPVGMQHILIGKERGAKLIVFDPRYTRTAAHAHLFGQMRPGTDIAVIWGLLWHIFENGWEDKEYIQQRVYAMDEVMAVVKQYTPDEVENISGIDKDTMYKAAHTLAHNKPGMVCWAMGGTQHTVGNGNTRAYCILELALGNIGQPGGGANIFRGHDNVQGATDMGCLSNTLPAYYGLSEGAWKHWTGVWDVDLDWVKGRFDQTKYGQGYPMNTTGLPCSRWPDAVLESPEKISQKGNVRGVLYWGQSVNTITRGDHTKKALDALDFMVIVDPHPSSTSILGDRKDGIYLLPAATQFETSGSVTASNRSIQWREKVIEPLFESKPDHTIMYLLAQKLGIAEPLTKHIQVNGEEPLVEDITREINKGCWTIGYTGSSPERLKKHQKNWHTFNFDTLKAEGGPIDGDYYGLPWPCWGTPEMKHPGTPILYNTSIPVSEGGLCFRARFGIEHEGTNILAEGSYPKGSEIEDGYPEFSAAMLQQLGWWDDLTGKEKAAAENKNWKTDLSGGIQRVAIKHGCAPFGNAKARCNVWTFPDHVPIHREPLYTVRRDLLPKYETHDDFEYVFRLPTLYKSIQQQDHSADFPLIITSFRLVEYEGGGDETRSISWLAELQQEMFVEVNPADCNDYGVQHDDMVWLESPEGNKIQAKVMSTPRIVRGVIGIPYHFAGHYDGEDITDRYPEGTKPYIAGGAADQLWTYGYDPVTNIQETKVSICKMTKVTA